MSNKPPRSRPISHYLKRYKTREKQVEKAQEWAREWYEQQIQLLTVLDNSAERDWAAFDAAMKRLRVLTHRKLGDALPYVLELLTQPLPPSRELDGQLDKQDEKQ